MNADFQIEPTYELPDVVWIEGRDHWPAIRSLVRRQGRLWALGQQVLLASPDGATWNDEARNLRREGSFNVCAVAESDGELRVFARNRNGLICYRLDPWTLSWEVLSEIETDSPCLTASWTNEGFVLSLRSVNGTEIRGLDRGFQRKWSGFLPGVVGHWQMTEEGIGLCGLWDGNLSAPNSSSEVYSTVDCGRNWTLVGRIPEMVLAGTVMSCTGALLGAGGGLLTSVADGQVTGEWREAGGDVVAVDSEGGDAIGVVEPEELDEVHRFLFRSDGGGWTAVDVQFGERISALKVLKTGEFLIASEGGIYRCRRRIASVV